MILTALGIGNYRSIGARPVMLDMTKRVNVIAGANNSGKSNVLRTVHWLSEYMHGDRTQRKKGLSEFDKHHRSGAALVQLELWVAPENDEELMLPKNESASFVYELGEREFTCKAHPFAKVDWRRFETVMEKFLRKQFRNSPPENQLEALKLEVGAYVFNAVLPQQLPKAFMVPQFRQITPGSTYSVQGEGVVSLLASWQNPALGKDEDRLKFERLQELLRKLLNMSDLTLDVPRSNDQIIVARPKLRLPLDSYGTGVHELMLLAIAVSMNENVIYCIEEPEIHLHPRLQKEFLKFLHTTSNKYLLSTHSNALLGPDGQTNIVHVRNESGSTVGRTVESSGDTLRLLGDLGVQASDILQANCVIWVEGPSDRIYLKKWISLLDAELREGVDFSIMFYGGRLLSHLSVERELEAALAEDFVRLLRINQRSAILIDSDFSAKKRVLNKTKERVRDECKSNGTHCWITHGREIENYLPLSVITEAYAALTGTRKEIKFNKFQSLEKALKRAYGREWKPGWSYNECKPFRAHAIAEHMTKAHIDANNELAVALNDLLGYIRQT